MMTTQEAELWELTRCEETWDSEGCPNEVKWGLRDEQELNRQKSLHTVNSSLEGHCEFWSLS